MKTVKKRTWIQLFDFFTDRYAMDPVQKQKYHEFAAEMRQEHFRMHPDFKWKTSNEPNEKPQPTDEQNEGERVFTELKPITDQSLMASSEAKPHSTDFGFGQKEDFMSHFPITPSTENSLSPVNSVEEVEPFPADSQRAFRLGPTPVQLGRYRKKTFDGSKTNAKANNPSDSNTPHNVNKIETDEHLPPSINQTRFKNRFQSLPQFDFSTYRMSNEWDASPTLPSITYNTYSRKRAQPKPSNEPHKAKRIVGDRFFGPDFKVNSFKGRFFLT